MGRSALPRPSSGTTGSSEGQGQHVTVMLATVGRTADHASCHITQLLTDEKTNIQGGPAKVRPTYIFDSNI